MTEEFYGTMEIELGIPAFAIEAYCDDNHIKTEDELREYTGHLLDSYVGWFDDGLIGFAESVIEDMLFEGGFNEHPLASYIDADSFVRDLRAEGYRSIDGFVFRPA